MVGELEVAIKRIRPNFFVRIYSGWTFGVTAFLGLCTVGGLFFAIIQPQSFSSYDTTLIIAIMALFSILIAYRRGQQKLLPPIIIDELSSENSYTVAFCDNQSLREADEMTKPYFGRHGFIPFEQIEQWRLKNEKGFVQINNVEGVLCACFVILGLEPSFLDQFIAGRVTEHDIDSDVVMSFDNTKKEGRIYISGVVVRDPHSFMGRKRATLMLWAILQYIKKIFGFRKDRTFYAVGLTGESERLLKTMGFHICGNKGSRKDNSNLYRIDFNKKKWDELVARIGDYSKMVSFEVD